MRMVESRVERRLEAADQTDEEGEKIREEREKREKEGKDRNIMGRECVETAEFGVQFAFLEDSFSLLLSSSLLERETRKKRK